MIKKNDEIFVTVTDVTNLGYGVAKYDGETVFVRGTVTGDVLNAKIIKKYPTYAIAIPSEYSCFSKHRCENDCASFPACGGCAYRHIDYGFERELKRKYVLDCFKKEGIDVNVADVAFTKTYGYRNKVQYPVARNRKSRLFLGFYSEYSHKAVDSTGCLTESPSFVGVKKVITEAINELGYTEYDEKTKKGILRHVFLRSNKNGEVYVCFVINAVKLPESDKLVGYITSKCPDVVGIAVNINMQDTNVIMGEKTYVLWGNEALTDIICGKHFEISPKSFWQINRDTAEMLYEKGKSELKLSENESLLDLYCGIGSIGLSVSDKNTRLVGVEIVPEAVADAKKNASLNGFENAHFVCGDAEIGFEECKKRYGTVDAVILDPPRKGVSRQVIDSISKEKIKKVLYISCNPATLARDALAFVKNGYNVNTVYPFDMFPRTGHVESLVCLTRQTN